MSEYAYIIDTFSLMFQVFHAIPPMTSPAGQPTNALFGFARDLVAIMREKKPAWMICAWDAPGPAYRAEIYPEYKANRSETPEDLVFQIPLIKEMIEAFGILVVDAPGWEADDVLATLAKQLVAKEVDVRLVTTDKDARQLIQPRVRLLNLRKNALMDEAGLQDEWGIRPNQVVDFQSLVGDSVDNVPGVPLVGPKKAAALLNQFGTLEAVLANADKAPGAKLQSNLKEFGPQALMSRELVRLRDDLPLDVDWQKARSPQMNVARLQDMFRQFGFRRLIHEVEELAPRPVAPAARPKKTTIPGQRSLFDDLEDSPRSSEAGSSISKQTVSEALVEARAPSARIWHIVRTEEEFKTFVEHLRQQSEVCIDLETTHVDPRRAAIVGWAISWQAGEGWYLPVMGPAGETHLDHQQVVDTLKEILEGDQFSLSNQNVKYDLIVLKSVGIVPTNINFDPMVADYLLDAGARSHNLEVLAEKYLHEKVIPISELIGQGKQQRLMSEIAINKVAEYASEDADLVVRLRSLLPQRLESDGLMELYRDVERPLISILADMEFRGIRVDSAELATQSAQLAIRLEQLMGEIYELAGREFNIDSPIQLRKVLFEEQNLPIRRRTKTGPSTDQDVLEELAALHPLPARITEHRHLSKLKGTYLDALPGMVHPQTGRIHCSFNQVVAATGRLSSSDPNLQNIPIRTQEGRSIRRAFVPGEPGWKFLCADYSQIELRVLAHFSEDAALLEAFTSGADIHSAVASQVFGVAAADVTTEQRRMAKAVNFGVIYGQSAFGLAAALGISREEAAAFIDGYFHRYRGVRQYLYEVLEDCRDAGYAKTILGRRRPIEGIRARRAGNLNMAERTAINSVIQGSAADLIKVAMIRLDQRLRREQHPALLLLQIHDELVWECPEGDLSSLALIVRAEMEQALPLRVPIVVDMSIGSNWLDTEDLR